MKNQIPEKPKTMKDQIDQLWDAMYNHLPTRLHWQDIKINFILAFMSVVLALIVVILVFIARI